MEIAIPVIAAVVCGVSIYAVSVVINTRVRPLNMRKMQIQAITLPIVVFIMLLLVLNM